MIRDTIKDHKKEAECIHSVDYDELSINLKPMLLGKGDCMDESGKDSSLVTLSFLEIGTVLSEALAKAKYVLPQALKTLIY